MSRSVKQDYDKLRELQAEGRIITEAVPLHEASAEVIDILDVLASRIPAGLIELKERKAA